MSNRLNRNLRLLVIGAWYSYRALFAWFRPLAYVSSKIVSLFMLMLFVFMGRFAGLQDSIYIVVGNVLLLTAVSGVLGVTMTVGNERNFRTLSYLLGSPAPRVPLFLGRTLFNIADGMLTVLAAIIGALVFFGLDLSQANLILLSACIAIISLTASALGLILGSTALVTREGWNIASAIFLALYFLCGVNFPVEVLPHSLQAVSYALPLTRGIAATRLVLTGGGWTDIAPLLGGEILVGLFYAGAGYLLFRYVEKWSMVSGQLDAV